MGPDDPRNATTTLEDRRERAGHGAPRALGPLLFRFLCGDDLSQPPARYSLGPLAEVDIGRARLPGTGPRERALRIDLPDRFASSHHAHLERGDGGWRIRDEGSRNGTLVNDQRAPTGEHVPLRDGDLIEIGHTFFLFRGTARGISDSSLEPIPGEADPPTLRPEWELELAKAARLSRTARLVPVSVSLHEVTLFELDGDEDVSHRRHGEDQVRDGHRRRRPEGDDETEIDGMADVPIESGNPEPKRPVRLALQIHEHLPQAEEIEMV